MPNRILKESICTSESISELSWFEQALFIRLIVLADDYGRFDARPAIIKGRGFPLFSVTDRQISDALSSLGTAGIVNLYNVGGKPYLQLKTWEKHQSIRAKKSKYPSPDDTLLSSEIICEQAQANVPVIQSESESESKSESERAPENSFAAFWAVYPKRQAKKEAFKAWNKINPSPELRDKIISSVEAQSRSLQWTKDAGQFIPMPSTYLNGRRWEDEIHADDGIRRDKNGRIPDALNYPQRKYSDEDIAKMGIMTFDEEV